MSTVPTAVLFIVLTFVAAMPAHARDIDLAHIKVLDRGKIVVARVLPYSKVCITADHIEYQPSSGLIRLRGHCSVSVNRGKKQVLTAEGDRAEIKAKQVEQDMSVSLGSEDTGHRCEYEPVPMFARALQNTYRSPFYEVDWSFSLLGFGCGGTAFYNRYTHTLTQRIEGGGENEGGFISQNYYTRVSDEIILKMAHDMKTNRWGPNAVVDLTRYGCVLHTIK